jgi:hypothetical protein
MCERQNTEPAMRILGGNRRGRRNAVLAIWAIITILMLMGAKGPSRDPLDNPRKTNGAPQHIFLFHAPSSDRLTMAQKASLKSLAYFHPASKLIVYSNNSLDAERLSIVAQNAAAIEVRPLTEQLILNMIKQIDDDATRTQIQQWASKLPIWTQGKHWHTHQTDLLRFLTMYLYGGSSSDWNFVWLRSFQEITEGIVADYVQDNQASETCSFCIASNMYAATSILMNFPAKSPVFLHALRNSFHMDHYDPDCFGCVGPRALSAAVLALRVNLLHSGVAFPIRWDESWWMMDNADNIDLTANRLSTILAKSYAVHMSEHANVKNTLDRRSAFSQILQRFLSSDAHVSCPAYIEATKRSFRLVVSCNCVICIYWRLDDTCNYVCGCRHV